MTIAMLPFTYPVTCVPKGRRAEMVQWILDETPVEIPDVAADDAPDSLKLNMRMRDDRHYAQQLIRRVHQGRPMFPLEAPSTTFRGIRGAASIANDLTKDNIDACMEFIRRPGARIHWTFYPLDLNRNTEMGGAEKIPDGLPWREGFEARAILRNQREAYLAEAIRELAHVVAIDGRIWIEGPEPTWRVSLPTIYERRQTPTIELQWHAAAYDVDTFRGDRLADAVAYAHAMSGRAPIVYGDIEGSEEITWKAPEASKVTRKEVSRIVEIANRSGLSKQPAEFFAPFCRMRDRLNANPKFHAEHVAATIEDMREIDLALKPASDEVKELEISRLLRWAVDKVLAHAKVFPAEQALDQVADADLEAMSAAFGR